MSERKSDIQEEIDRVRSSTRRGVLIGGLLMLTGTAVGAAVIHKVVTEEHYSAPGWERTVVDIAAGVGIGLGGGIAIGSLRRGNRAISRLEDMQDSVTWYRPGEGQTFEVPLGDTGISFVGVAFDPDAPGQYPLPPEGTPTPPWRPGRGPIVEGNVEGPGIPQPPQSPTEDL